MKILYLSSIQRSFKDVLLCQTKEAAIGQPYDLYVSKLQKQFYQLDIAVVNNINKILCDAETGAALICSCCFPCRHFIMSFLLYHRFSWFCYPWLCSDLF